MQKLDADAGVLTSRAGLKSKRDIVQFVEMRKIAKPGVPFQAAIAKTLLEELPLQVLSFFKAMNITPNEAAPPPPFDDSDPSAVDPDADVLNSAEEAAKRVLLMSQSAQSLPSPS